MAGIDEYFDERARLWEEEGLFARDMEGRLIRVVAATAMDYDKIVTLTIDGREVHVPQASPTKDAQGNLVLDKDGRTIPRKTTIYDAAVQLFKDTPNQLPIPVLCHAPHLRPVGVCRVCSVAVSKLEDDPHNPGKKRERSSGKLVPACVQPVEPRGMVVHTMQSLNEREATSVRSSVKVLLELLAADHLPSAQSGSGSSDFERLMRRLGPRLEFRPQRFAPAKPLDYQRDTSSPFIDVDHNACILCDRCSRACNDVKHNYVIGRTGKGYRTRVGFDLNVPMLDSSCVACGECMLSCPTQALTFRRPIETQWWLESLEQPGKSMVRPDKLDDHPLLGCLPYRFREWNQSSIVRWRLKKGEELCHVGDYGSTAFLLNSGSFGIYAPTAASTSQSTAPTTVFDRLMQVFKRPATPESHALELGSPIAISTPADILLGEMSCLSFVPRNATIVALEESEVFEIRRNVLFALQRNPQARKILDSVYRQRALRAHLDSVPFFADLTPEERNECRNFLRDKVDLLRLDPDQTIFRQGEQADAFYMVRIGYVKFLHSRFGQEEVVNYLGPNKHFGEIGLVAEMPDLAQLIPEEIRTRRTATCAALDDVELVRIGKAHFQEMLSRFPKLKERFIRNTRDLVKRQEELSPAHKQTLQEFTRQGLFNAQKLLVLDLEACTRCDECSKACADTHGGQTRLVRDGFRFDKWLVASACRSCTDPYCLVGCPVDAIHRLGGQKEIRIESHCIGCGLCANNCPYGNINMQPTEVLRDDPENPGRMTAVIENRATTCDLCHDLVGPGQDVSCVFACPHNAAFRMSGEELLERVGRAES